MKLANKQFKKFQNTFTMTMQDTHRVNLDVEDKI